MHCCHPNSKSLTDDPTFAEDEFTQSALYERKVRAAHAHGLALALTALGSLFVFHVARKCCRGAR